jgi:hypothetical protein
MTMKMFVLCLGVAGAVACGGGAKEQTAKPAAAPAKAAPTLADEVDAMCACKAPACASEVHTRFAAVDQANASSSVAHVSALEEELKTCESKAREGDEMGTMQAMTGDMCACKDGTCVEGVVKKYDAFVKRMEEKYTGDAKPNDELMKLGERMSKCVEDAMTKDKQARGEGRGIDGKSHPSHEAPDTGGDDDEEDSLAKYGEEEAKLAAERAAKRKPYTGNSLADIGGTTGVKQCDLYLRSVDKFMKCDEVPQQAKDAVYEGVDAMKSGWGSLKDRHVPKEAKKAAADACTQALDALRQSAKALGCKKI